MARGTACPTCPTVYNRELSSPLEQAGCWFLRSGIQESSGGVARYFHSDTNRNAAVSTEITGYAVSALEYLHSATGDSAFLDAARRAARYLTNDAWDGASHTFPFEPGSPHAYFFDVGIIARGLVAAGRATGDEAFLNRANDAALSLAYDFLGDGVFHPVIALPEKQPLEYEPRWSRQPGCYQLKSALAWLQAGESGAQLFDEARTYFLARHESFLAEDCPREKMMDRLHAYCYFLEALLFGCERADSAKALAWGIDRVAGLLRDIAPDFERSDVCAQLLRVRLIAHHHGAMALDETAAREEAGRAAGYHDASDNPKLAGGYWFGRKRGEMLPFMNPVSTAFCMQALDLWEQHNTRTWHFDLRQLI
jgi:hypothetical protein